MQILKTTPYSITVEHEGSILNVQGESFARGYGSPDFVIFRNSITHWTNHENKFPLDKEMQREIVDFLLTELRSRNWAVEVE